MHHCQPRLDGGWNVRFYVDFPSFSRAGLITGTITVPIPPAPPARMVKLGGHEAPAGYALVVRSHQSPEGIRFLLGEPRVLELLSGGELMAIALIACNKTALTIEEAVDALHQHGCPRDVERAKLTARIRASLPDDPTFTVDASHGAVSVASFDALERRLGVLNLRPAFAELMRRDPNGGAVGSA